MDTSVGFQEALPFQRRGATSPRTQRIAIELCGGFGGIGIGLRSLGYRIANAYDSWEEAVAVYNHNSREAVAKTCNLLSETGRLLALRRTAGHFPLYELYFLGRRNWRKFG
jgi:hypothetical protein